ncbi:MAG: fumarylacetoacetate hydrolase family protein [Thermoleophilia bacterium]|nr:fumarylacetoacetate hydrolase family protein [Thermoleophilia bacterium]
MGDCLRLVQFHDPFRTGRRLGLVEEDRVYDLTSANSALDSFMALLELSGGRVGELASGARSAGEKVGEDAVHSWAAIDREPHPDTAHLLIPISAPEVWGFGVTYRRSAEARDADVARATDASASIYDRVYHSERPECFFKATPPRCTGPYGIIGIRSDSVLTATEPELAYVLGKDREIVGYTICNDVSAWDLERENPLYLPQSKIFTGCCALGPAITLAAGGPDPYALEIACRIIRDEKVIYEDSTSSGNIGRRFEELNEYLYRDNPVPVGTVVSTGTGIMVPNEYSLKDGDLVEIDIGGIGTLRNTARKLGG